MKALGDFAGRGIAGFHTVLRSHQRRDGAGHCSAADRRRLPVLSLWDLFGEMVCRGSTLVVGPEGTGGRIIGILWRARATGGTDVLGARHRATGQGRAALGGRPPRGGRGAATRGRPIY